MNKAQRFFEEYQTIRNNYNFRDENQIKRSQSDLRLLLEKARHAKVPSSKNAIFNEFMLNQVREEIEKEWQRIQFK